jgi:glycosyltransferase involved in cell wall biosynthesis
MRILLVTHGLPPHSVGGVEQHVDGLARALVQVGHDVHVLARDHLSGHAQGSRIGPEPLDCHGHGGARVTRLAYRWEDVDSLDAIYECRPMADAVAAFLAERAAAGETFDVAHVHHLTGLSTDTLQALAHAGVPTVLTLHDYWLFCPRGQMFHRREEVCEAPPPARCAECLQATFPHWLGPDTSLPAVARLRERALHALRIPARLVVPSARAIPPLVAFGVPAERFTVVENGVDTESLAALAAPPAGPGPLRIGYLGTLIPSKGLHVLLDAFDRLPAGSAELHIAGNAVPYHGDETYLTRCFQRLRPGRCVTYHGPYGLGDLPVLLDRIDVLAAPALWHESFGLTVREALAAGRPVLVSRIGGLQDAVADGVHGRVLPPGDVAAWAAALHELVGDRALVRRLASAARPRARGFAAMVADLLPVYRAAAAPSAAIPVPRAT